MAIYSDGCIVFNYRQALQDPAQTSVDASGTPVNSALFCSLCFHSLRFHQQYYPFFAGVSDATADSDGNTFTTYNLLRVRIGLPRSV